MYEWATRVGPEVSEGHAEQAVTASVRFFAPRLTGCDSQADV